METRIGIGILIGLALTITIFIWKSDYFTQSQKILLSFFILFPPAQWVLAFLIHLYNIGKHHIEEKEVDSSDQKNGKRHMSTEDKKENLLILRDNGLITNTIYQEKLKLINDDIINQNLYKSKAYISSKKLFDNGLLNEQELENIIESLRKKI